MQALVHSVESCIVGIGRHIASVTAIAEAIDIAMADQQRITGAIGIHAAQTADGTEALCTGVNDAVGVTNRASALSADAAENTAALAAQSHRLAQAAGQFLAELRTA